MIIMLNDMYRVRGIPMNFVLEERKTRLKGENAGTEYWSESGYFPDLEMLLIEIATRHLQATETEGIELLIKEIKDGALAIAEQIRLLGDN